MMPDVYRGSGKHKRRPIRGDKGTYCPEWTHRTDIGGHLRLDMYRHDWPDTEAQRLLDAASVHLGTGRRYVTKNGIAFEAKATRDGTWHGFPVPWDDVPFDLHDLWKTQRLVTRSQIKQYSEVGGSIDWAMDTDDE